MSSYNKKKTELTGLFDTNVLKNIVMACLTMPVTAMAQQPEEMMTEDAFLEDIPLVLSATRLEQSKHDAPSSTTVITRDMIEASGVQEIADIFRLLPGFQVAHVSGNTFAVTYHGLSFEYPRKFQIMVDGRSVFRPLLSNVDWANLGIAIDDIEKIEVVRGPNTPAYGTNAILGSINIITRQPYQDEGVYIKSTGGNQKTRHMTARLSGGDEKYFYRLTQGVRRDNGYDNVPDAKEVGFMSFKLNYDLSVKQKLNFDFGYSGGDLGLGENDNILNPARTRDVDSYHGLVRWSVGLSQTDELYVQLYYNYYESSDTFQVGPLSEFFNVPPAAIPLLFGGQPDQTLTIGLLDGKADRADIELQHILKPWDTFRLVWGLSLRKDRLKGQYMIDKAEYVEDESARIFSNAEWRIVKPLVVNAGFMVEDNDIIGRKTSPRMALNYHITSNHTLRTSYTKAYRTPSLYEANAHWVSRFNDGELLQVMYTSDPDIKAEELKSYEFAYIGDIPSIKTSLDIKAFREETRGVITAPNDYAYSEPYVNDGAKIWMNSGDVITRGIETQITIHPQKQTSMALQYGYAEMEGLLLDDVNPVLYKDASTNVPKHTISALLSHQWLDGYKGSVAFYRMTGMEWEGDGDMVGAYKRWDVRAAKDFRYQGGAGSIAVVWQNFFNEEYQEFRVENVSDKRTYVTINFSL